MNGAQLFNNVIFCDTIFFTSESRNMLLEDISRYELFIENHSSCNHLVGRISRFYVLLAGFYTQILSSGISTAASINVLYLRASSSHVKPHQPLNHEKATPEHL